MKPIPISDLVVTVFPSSRYFLKEIHDKGKYTFTYTYRNIFDQIEVEMVCDYGTTKFEISKATGRTLTDVIDSAGENMLMSLRLKEDPDLLEDVDDAIDNLGLEPIGIIMERRLKRLCLKKELSDPKVDINMSMRGNDLMIERYTVKVTVGRFMSEEKSSSIAEARATAVMTVYNQIWHAIANGEPLV